MKIHGPVASRRSRGFSKTTGGKVRREPYQGTLFLELIVRVSTAKLIFILGKYGKILKVAVNQSTAYAGTQVSFFHFGEFRKKP